MNCTFNVLKLHVKDELSKDEEEKISNSVTSFANKKEGNDEQKKPQEWYSSQQTKCIRFKYQGQIIWGKRTAEMAIFCGSFR